MTVRERAGGPHVLDPRHPDDGEVGQQPEREVDVFELELGDSARELLEDPRVAELLVVQALAFARGDQGFEARQPGRRFDAILVDIDHTPLHVLDPSHATSTPRWVCGGWSGT